MRLGHWLVVGARYIPGGLVAIHDIRLDELTLPTEASLQRILLVGVWRHVGLASGKSEYRRSEEERDEESFHGPIVDNALGGRLSSTARLEFVDQHSDGLVADR